MHKLVQLGIDIYNGKVEHYNGIHPQEVLRKAIFKAMDCEDEVFNKHKFNENKYKVFAIIEETISVLVGKGIGSRFEPFAETKELNRGDQFKFKIRNTDLFEVSVLANGSRNLQRQYIGDGRDLLVRTKQYGVKIYSSLISFLAGRIDWVEMIDRVARSFEQQLATDIYNAVYNVYSKLRPLYQITGSFDYTKTIQLAARVEALTGEKVQIIGTKTALSKIQPSQLSDRAKEEVNSQGYYGMLGGYEVVLMPQALKVNSDEFAIADDFLLILPTNQEKFVKIAIEGETDIVESMGDNQGMEKEYTFLKNLGVEVLVTQQFGYVKLA